MKISSSDCLLFRFSRSSDKLLRWIGNWESRHLADQLQHLVIERPIFICGLARSGSTLLLELYSQVAGTATHRYRDFPFLQIPFLWNRFLDRFPATDQPAERPHRDRIRITRESPEAMEEPLWQAWFPDQHSEHSIHRLSAETQHPEFERFHRDHLKKILLIRSGQRYVAKNNYHVARIEYLSRLYPDAEFVIPIRHPLTHVESLVRQHRLFCEYAGLSPRVVEYLTAAGHYEFGPQRVPVRLNEADGDRISQDWAGGDDAGGYGIQWKEVYGFVRNLLHNEPRLQNRIHIVRHEDFCGAPTTQFCQLLHRTGLDDAVRTRGPSLEHVSLAQHPMTLDRRKRAAIWAEVSNVAEYFGYTEDGLQ